MGRSALAAPFLIQECKRFSRRWKACLMMSQAFGWPMLEALATFCPHEALWVGSPTA
jgi:hypothetical protein